MTLAASPQTAASSITVVPRALSITCPSNITVRATSPAGAVVNYIVTASGGCPPITVIGNPPSGSTFPIGTTTVNCTATDGCGQQANCSFTVTVLRQLQKRFYQQNLLPPTNGCIPAAVAAGARYLPRRPDHRQQHRPRRLLGGRPAATHDRRQPHQVLHFPGGGGRLVQWRFDLAVLRRQQCPGHRWDHEPRSGLR